ncbi:MAG: hypothetical protein ABJQ29_08185 [Luteolibacter sp.]
MASGGNTRPYLDAWLKRVGKQLSASGRLSELVLILSGGMNSENEIWRKRLQRILDREEEPDPELLMKIDLILARPTPRPAPEDDGDDLFG